VSELHQQRTQAVLEQLLRSGKRSVVDLGCGDGDLLSELLKHPLFERLAGVDSSMAAVAAARDRLGQEAASRVELHHARFDEKRPELLGYEAAVLLETLEHIEPRLLSRVERSVFGYLKPDIVLITTPNREYNALAGMAEGALRHPEHHFEWTRAQFRQWCAGIASRNRYTACFSGIGYADPLRGAPTQMAVFTRL
jgi:small RNA 2'-O-methyltransferase